MTNFEYYKEEILKIINDKSAFGVCKNSNQPIACENSLCDICIAEGVGLCDKAIYPWLYAEYTEQPKLTKKERQFCELVETGWITKNLHGSIEYWACTKKPNSLPDGEWLGFSDYNFTIGSICISYFDIMKQTFSFMTDKEPWSIEDLLKLEVEE